MLSSFLHQSLETVKKKTHVHACMQTSNHELELCYNMVSVNFAFALQSICRV